MNVALHPRRNGSLGGVRWSEVPVDDLTARPPPDSRQSQASGNISPFRIGMTEKLQAYHLLAMMLRNWRQVATPLQGWNTARVTLAVDRGEYAFFQGLRIDTEPRHGSRAKQRRASERPAVHFHTWLTPASTARYDSVARPLLLVVDDNSRHRARAQPHRAHGVPALLVIKHLLNRVPLRNHDTCGGRA